MILPSKKVLSIFILVAALVAAIIITFGRDKASSAINYTSNLVAGEKVKIPENPNWQNELSGIAINTEPAQVEDASSTPETATDAISTALMSNYLALKQSGTLDTTSTQKLLDQTVGLFDQFGSKVVLNTNLNVIPDNGKQSIADYGENLGNILRNDKPKVVIDERQVITAAISSNDPSKMAELDAVIAVYEKMANDFTKMPVPQIFVKAHLDLVNGLNNLVLSLTEVKKVLNDPVSGLTALQTYGKSAVAFTQAMAATKDFITKNKIIYKQGSGGYYLLYGI